MVAVELHVAVRTDEEHRRAGELASQELQQQQRGRVGGLQVIEDQDDRAFA